MNDKLTPKELLAVILLTKLKYDEDEFTICPENDSILWLLNHVCGDIDANKLFEKLGLLNEQA